MCGLVGFTNPGPGAAALIAEMRDLMRHRGPDDAGAFVDAQIALGHRRLAIIDLSGGAQPRVDPASGDVLVFNGEIYGFDALADDLRRRRIVLRDRSDTEVLFHMLREYGVWQTLERIDGMFAFAFREGRSGNLYLARDRFGEKPLFYAETGGSFIFGSEISALRRHPALRAAGIDREAAFQFLTFEYLPGERSGWQGIAKLLPGHVLTYTGGAVTIRPFWQPRLDPVAPPGGEAEAVDELERLLRVSVARRLVADVPVGVFLSGGVDSSLIAALAAEHAPNITAFTVRMPAGSFDESRHATLVAQHLGMPHEVVDISSADLAFAFNVIADRLDEPLADSSLLPTHLVCAAARRSMKVALGGDGADELFAGYPNFRAQLLAPAMEQIPQALGALFRRGLALAPVSPRYMSRRFMLSQLSYGLGQPSALQSFLWMAAFSIEENAALWRPEARPAAPFNVAFAPVQAWLERGAPQGGMERLLYLFLVTYLAEDILVKTDRASMLNSLEVRSPFLDRAFAEYVLGLPTTFKLHRGATKYLLKKLAARFVPREQVYRKKHGFALPLAALLRGPLAESVRETILDPGNPLADWFNMAIVERLVCDHATGRRDYAKKIWSLFVLFRVAARPPAASVDDSLDHFVAPVPQFVR